MKTRWMVVPMVGLLAAGCGGDAGGLSASGTVTVTVHQSGQPDGATGFNLGGGTLVDAPPGNGQGFNGTCVRAGSQWTLSLARSDSLAEGLRRVTLTFPATGGDGGSVSPTASLTLGTSTFSAGGTCTGTATAAGTSDVRVAVHCTGLQASSDPRTVDATATLTLTGCTGS